jgi:hypothetical protein
LHIERDSDHSWAVSTNTVINGVLNISSRSIPINVSSISIENVAGIARVDPSEINLEVFFVGS